MNHIADGIYLGDVGDGVEWRARNRITLYVHEQEMEDYTPTHHIPILTVVPDRQLLACGDDDYRHIDYNRGQRLASRARLDECAEIIEDYVSINAEVLVHCLGGIERSPLTLVWWLYKSSREISFDNAYHYIRGKRPIIEDRRYWLER